MSKVMILLWRVTISIPHPIFPLSCRQALCKQAFLASPPPAPPAIIN